MSTLKSAAELAAAVSKPDRPFQSARHVGHRVERDGAVRHFWAGEMGGTADPGQDPRGAPDIARLWNIMDLTPRGRGSGWYPKLEYAAAEMR